jgi:methylmalonyl-CoA/ethylmalonyl-CoA epimerase
MILSVEHLGLAVSDSEKAIQTFEKLLDRKLSRSEVVDSEKVTTHFFRVGETQIELLESMDPSGVISKFIEKRGQGIHHVALRTDNIYAETKRLQDLGFEFLLPLAKTGADNKLINFIHPKCTEGVLIEICQEKTE